MADFALGAATWRTGRNILVVFDSDLFAPLREYMTSSEYRKYIMQCIAVRPHVTCRENLLIFGHMVFEICDRQTR